MTAYLPDTHVVLWWLQDDSTLADDVKELLDHEPHVYLSPATLWELAIKQALGKLAAPNDIVERVRDCGFRELPITWRHAIVAGRLPAYHRDPFDRMLIAQATVEGLNLMTGDAAIAKYAVPILLV